MGVLEVATSSPRSAKVVAATAINPTPCSRPTRPGARGPVEPRAGHGTFVLLARPARRGHPFPAGPQLAGGCAKPARPAGRQSIESLLQVTLQAGHPGGDRMTPVIETASCEALPRGHRPQRLHDHGSRGRIAALIGPNGAGKLNLGNRHFISRSPHGASGRRHQCAAAAGWLRFRGYAGCLDHRLPVQGSKASLPTVAGLGVPRAPWGRRRVHTWWAGRG